MPNKHIHHTSKRSSHWKGKTGMDFRDKGQFLVGVICPHTPNKIYKRATRHWAPHEVLGIQRWRRPNSQRLMFKQRKCMWWGWCGVIQIIRTWWKVKFNSKGSIYKVLCKHSAVSSGGYRALSSGQCRWGRSINEEHRGVIKETVVVEEIEWSQFSVQSLEYEYLGEKK